jgi:hypothetical protein
VVPGECFIRVQSIGAYQSLTANRNWNDHS